jgi:uncharacterized protein YbbK (DUF523 family)
MAEALATLTGSGCATITPVPPHFTGNFPDALALYQVLIMEDFPLRDGNDKHVTVNIAKEGMQMDIVSACLCGINCKYNGKNNLNKDLKERVMRGELLPVCPEVLGGLSIPRMPCEIRIGRVYAKDGRDVTEKFTDGARKTLAIAKAAGAKKAILKQRSPSCGCGKIYDGSFTGKIIEGDGITATLLKQNGIEILTDEDL